eukprot:COSAG06_NODE_58288_length_277_cov_0.988764_1_plen_80_part_01
MCSIPGTSQSHCPSVLSSGLPGPDNFGGRTGGFRGLLSRDRQKHFTNVLDHRRSSSGSDAARASFSCYEARPMLLLALVL